MSELFHLSGFGFTYPQQRTPALTDVELTIRSGEFWVLCGPSGCGKSTLLRQLKTVLAPHGITEGEVYFQGTPLREIPLRQQAADAEDGARRARLAAEESENSCRRRLRELYRLHGQEMLPGYDLIVVARVRAVDMP